MFVRWKKRFSSSKTPTYGGPHATHDYDSLLRKYIPKPESEQPCLLSAYLVKSVRIDGKPRQQATFLASISRSRLIHPYPRLYFWQKVQKHIEPLNLSVEEQRKIKMKLLEQVPDVTREEIDEAKKQRAESEARLRALLGRKA